MNFEREHEHFRGVNDKRIRRDQRSAVLVDTLDVGLYGQVGEERGFGGRARPYTDDAQLWRDVLAGHVGHGDRIKLQRVHLLEWLPACPGRYFTEEAAEARNEARRFWDWGRGEYLPLGKLEMVLGGIGSVRLAPRVVRGGDVCFFGASSTAVSHQGVPIVIPADDSRALHRLIRTSGSCFVTLTGTLWPLPIDRSPLVFDRGIPKYFLFAEEVSSHDQPRHSGALVSVAITYSSTYEGATIPLEGLSVNPSKNWSFASFWPEEGASGLTTAVSWLKQYAVRYRRGHPSGEEGEAEPERVSILGDFDEVVDHFDNPVEFPLAQILRGRFDPRTIALYGSLYGLTIRQEVIMGDKFENVQNATIINRSVVQDAVKTVRSTSHADISAALSSVAELIERSQNAAAASVFNKFVTELKSEKPSKPILKQCWNGLTSILPDVAKLADAGAKLIPLFS